jgi:hypothetical protein
MHDKFLQIVRRLETDFEPFGKVPQDGQPDCSNGCRHFVKLAHGTADHWGVCSNRESPRTGMLTFEQQGCSVFDPITLDRSLADSQLRHIIAEASELLKERREQRNATTEHLQISPFAVKDEFIYDVKTSYFPHIKGHFPAVFRLEQHERSFVAISLETRISGSERPVAIARCSAKNGEVFKIVRENGEFSYQVPFSGKIYNLKQYGDLSRIGMPNVEALRPFLECVEPEIFDKIATDTAARLKSTRKHLEESRDRVLRWRQKQFWPNEMPRNARERREMLKEEEENVDRGTNEIAELEVFVEWLKGVDRSFPRLLSTPPPRRSR